MLNILSDLQQHKNMKFSYRSVLSSVSQSGFIAAFILCSYIKEKPIYIKKNTQTNKSKDEFVPVVIECNNVECESSKSVLDPDSGVKYCDHSLNNSNPPKLPTFHHFDFSSPNHHHLLENG